MNEEPTSDSAPDIRVVHVEDDVRLARLRAQYLASHEDHGIGVAEDDILGLLEPFFFADRSRTRGTGGCVPERGPGTQPPAHSPLAGVRGCPIPSPFWFPS